MAKKKKGGKKKGPAPETVVTTRKIIRERERCMCPRLGDAAVRLERAEAILMDCVEFKIRRAAERETLDLSRSHLAYVPAVPHQLVELDLSRNQLFGSDHVFAVLEPLSSLRRLDLSDNFLNGGLSSRATAMATLEELVLDNNAVTSLPDDAGNWRHMRRFSAARNALTALPASAGDWTDLVFLNLRGNKLSQLRIGDWAKLQTLFLGSNDLAKLNDDVNKLASLTELDVRSNSLTALPASLAECGRLTRVHAGNNKIAEVPPQILAALVDLEELHLYKNKLDKLPTELGCLTKCLRLSLSSTNIKTLPDTIASCASLNELYLNNCAKFANMPNAAGALANLKELQAKKCPSLKALPSTAVGWSALTELDLRAAKKQVCKLPPELVSTLEAQNCMIRGGVQKKKKK